MGDRNDIVQPDKFCITNVFQDTEYVIPIYQRNYAWGKDEIEQMLNDINDFQEDNYYLGNLIVNELGTDIFEVIDGQQRLTTLYLLLSFLNDGSVFHKQTLRFEAREKSNRTLQDIDKIEDFKSELSKTNWYSVEIVDGYSVIRRYFANKATEFIDNFKKKLASVIVVRIQVPKDIDLNHYFEIMNTRGEQLELHEIVKAKILGKIGTGDYVTEIDKKDKMIAATIWDACAQMDRYVQMSFPVPQREILFGKKWDTFMCENFDDFRDAFNDEKGVDETKFTLRSKLSNPVKDDVKWYGKDEEENERFESIVSFPNFVLQVNEAMNVSDTDNDTVLDDKRFFNLLERHWENSENAKKFIYSLLKYRYLFDRYIIKREYVGKYKEEGRWSLQKLEMYTDSIKGTKKPSYKGTINESIGVEDDSDGNDSNKQLRLLQSCLRITYTSPKTMHWIAKAMLAANEAEDGQEIIRVLESYCCKKIVEAEYKKRTGFNIERIVFTYLDYLLCRDYADEFKDSTIKDFQFQFRTSIEHFFPQNPHSNGSAVIVTDKDSLGNLALITVSANSRYSNMIPRNKVEEYPDVIKQSPKLMKMKELLDDNQGQWTDGLVQQHHDEMINLLEQEIRKAGYEKP